MSGFLKHIATLIARWIKGWRDCIDECKRKKIIDLSRGGRDKEP